MRRGAGGLGFGWPSLALEYGLGFGRRPLWVRSTALCMPFVGKRWREGRSGFGAAAAVGERERRRRCEGEGGAALWRRGKVRGRGGDVGGGRGAMGETLGPERAERKREPVIPEVWTRGRCGTVGCGSYGSGGGTVYLQ